MLRPENGNEQDLRALIQAAAQKHGGPLSDLEAESASQDFSEATVEGYFAATKASLGAVFPEFRLSLVIRDEDIVIKDILQEMHVESTDTLFREQVRVALRRALQNSEELPISRPPRQMK